MLLQVCAYYVDTCKAKRQRSTPIHNTYHLKSSFKCTLYPSILKNLDNMALCYTCYFPASLPRWALHKMEPGPSIAQDQDQDSLLVKRRNDNHSPGPMIRELVPSSHQRSELSNIVLCIFSRWDQRIGECIPIPDSLGEEATFINISISNGSLKCHRVLISSTPSFGDKVVCWYTGFTFKTFIYSRRAGNRCMNIIKISIARQPQKTFEKFMVIPKSRNTTPIWPIRTQKCHFSWPEKMVWCHHDISVRCFKHVRHLVRKTKWPNLASRKSGVTAETTARFNRKFAQKYDFVPFSHIYNEKNWNSSYQYVCEIVPIFVLETFFVPLFTKGPSRVRQNKLPI